MFAKFLLLDKLITFLIKCRILAALFAFKNNHFTFYFIKKIFLIDDKRIKEMEST